MPFEKKITRVAVLDSREAHYFTKGSDNRLAKLSHTLKAIPSRTNIESRKALVRLHDRLVLVAPPKTLGVLRKTLSKSLKDIIALELDKNFIKLAPHEIQKQLEDVIFI